MFHRVVALRVNDQEKYQKYRDGMLPILKEMGGDFLYDFKVDQTLKSPQAEQYNRVFVIVFPSEEVGDKFFSDEKYLAVREEFFNPSVEKATSIGSY